MRLRVAEAAGRATKREARQPVGRVSASANWTRVLAARIDPVRKNDEAKIGVVDICDFPAAVGTGVCRAYGRTIRRVVAVQLAIARQRQGECSTDAG
jgi:hypothetical protein